MRCPVTYALLPLLCVFLFPATGGTAIINIPADQPTIQDGIDVAADGDTILVAPGIHTTEIDTTLSNI